MLGLPHVGLTAVCGLRGVREGRQAVSGSEMDLRPRGKTKGAASLVLQRPLVRRSDGELDTDSTLSIIGTARTGRFCALG